MKFKTDFITNSSSASFIAVFAKINNIKKANKFIKKYKLKECIMTGEFIIENMKYIKFGADWAGVYINVPENIDNDSQYIYWSVIDENDQLFWNDECEFYDYNIDLDFFSDEEIEIYNRINEENGFTEIQKGYGAGRNG